MRGLNLHLLIKKAVATVCLASDSPEKQTGPFPFNFISENTAGEYLFS